MSSIRILGTVLSAVGIVAAVFPHWFGPITGSAEPAGDAYEAVERRVRGGMLLGLGLCFVAIASLRPWTTSIPSIIFYFMTGALAARVLGLIVDGITPKQWFLVAIETVAMALAAFWLWWSGRTGS